jgi:Ca2+-binding RTX toxin-like protein
VTSNALTVNYTVGGTATLGTDYTGIATTGTTKNVTFAANSSIATVTVDPTTDSTGESNETVALTLATGTGYTIGTTNAVTGTITDDDTSVSLAVSPGSITEDGTTNLVYTFTRTGVTSNALTVNYTVGGTATFNTDYTQSGATTYTATTGTIAFAPNSTTASITIDPTADTVAEPNETIGLTLSSGSGYTISTPNTVTGTITDDDSTVTLTVSPSSVAEDGTPNILFTFTRTGNITNPLTVNYTVGGTATFNVDYSQTGASSYTSTAGTVSFAANSSTATVTIDPTADTLTESDETVILTLLPGSYKIGTTTTTTGSTISESASGGFGITEKLYYISSAGGSFSLNYEMYSIPDKAEIFVNNVLKTQTNGFVSGSGSLNLNSVTLQTSDQVKVVITGNDPGTAWDYNVYYSGGLITTTPAPVTGTITSDDPFTGTPNADTLIGTTGADIFIGLTGNDTYTVNNAGDIVTEALNEGTDLVQASISYTLPDNVENLTLTGTTNVNGTGNSGNNVLTGNTGNNTLMGGGGSDTFNGGAGADILTGSVGGVNTYVFQFGQSSVSVTDRITNFAFGTDKIDLLTSAAAATGAPTSFSRAADFTATTTSTLTNVVNNIFADADGTGSAATGFAASSAALVNVTGGSIAGTYLLVNDPTVTFDATNDLIINITGYSGTLPGVSTGSAGLAVSSVFV